MGEHLYAQNSLQWCQTYVERFHQVWLTVGTKQARELLGNNHVDRKQWQQLNMYTIDSQVICQNESIKQEHRLKLEEDF